MPEVPQFAKLLPVITGHHDDGLLIFTPVFKGLHDPADLAVNIMQRIQIRTFQGGGPGGRQGEFQIIDLARL